MNSERVTELLHGINDFGVRSKAREFAIAPQDEQNLHLFLAVEKLNSQIAALQEKNSSKPLAQRLYDYGVVGALLAYVLYDRGQIPPMFGGGK